MDNFDLEDPLKSFEEQQTDSISALFSLESDHMPSYNYFECLKTGDFHVTFRQEAISLILQAEYSCNIDPYTQYLAVNYMDRFISSQEIPQGSSNPWVVRLLVIACISLAAKMKEIHFSFQSDEGFVFDASTIRRMELLILHGLNWRMRSITPFSFVNFFLSSFHPPLTQAFKDRATNIIFQSRNEIKLIEFKPSIIAGISSSSGMPSTIPVAVFGFRVHNFVLSIREQKSRQEKLLGCYNAIKEMVNNETSEYVVSSSRTPTIVLDCHCNKSDCGSSANTMAMPENREIKLNGFCCESNKMKISQIQPCG